MNSSWLVSRKFDFLFFFPVWLLPILGFAYSYSEVEWIFGQPFGHTFFWLYFVFLMTPHISFSFFLTWGIPEVKKSPAKNKIIFQWLPILVVTVFLGSHVLFREGRYNFFYLLMVIAFFWGSLHVTMQNFGILQIYRRKNKIEPDSMMLKAEKVIFLLAAFLVVFRLPFYHLKMSTIDGWLDVIGAVIMTLILVLLVVHIVRTIRVEQEKQMAW